MNADVAMTARLSTNQAAQWTAFPRPIVRIVSFNRCSFSYTMD